MKRLTVVFICLCLLLATAVGEGTEESIRLQVDGRDLTLGFDPTEGYSSVQDGSVQASFYAYVDNEQNLYELYMIFPESVQTGDRLSWDDSLGGVSCTVGMFITVDRQERFYYAGKLEKGSSSGSSYAISFDSVTDTGDGVRYTGRLTATLLGMDTASGSTVGSIQIDDAAFSFTMPNANRRDAGGGSFGPTPTPNADATPAATPAPTPEATPMQTWRV